MFTGHRPIKAILACFRQIPGRSRTSLCCRGGSASWAPLGAAQLKVAGDHAACPFPCHTRASVNAKRERTVNQNVAKTIPRDGHLFICRNNLADLKKKKGKY